MTYEQTAIFPGFEKVPVGELPLAARGAVAYPAQRTVDGVRLTEREYRFVKKLSCKSRVVFWLYYKFKIPAREIAKMFGNGFLDQHAVYMRNRPIKKALFQIETDDKNIDWAEVQTMMDEGATESEIVEFYGVTLKTLRKYARG